MAKFYLLNGAVGLRKSATEELRFPVPAAATDVISFDEEANAAAIAAFDSDYASHSLSGGVLRRNGVAVDLSAVSQNKQDRDAFTQAVNAIGSNQAYLGIANPTNAQVVSQVRTLTQQNNGIIRRLVLLLKEQGLS